MSAKIFQPTMLNTKFGTIMVTECVCDTCADEWTSVQVRSGTDRRRFDMHSGMIRGFYVRDLRFCSLGCAMKSDDALVKDRVRQAIKNRGDGDDQRGKATG